MNMSPPPETPVPAVPPEPGVQLLGRRAERRALDGLLEGVRAGRGSALVVLGEAGVGKSALLDHLAGRACDDCRVVRAAGVESEAELPLAGLQQLLGPLLLERAELLPAPQRDALRRSLGVNDGPAPDQFLVGMAVLGVLAEVAIERPLICLLDDEQWLDRASARLLSFVARRLQMESVAIVFTARLASPDLAGLPELVLEGLDDADSRALLDSALAGPIDARVRDQIVSEARGNPLALLELPRGMRPAELAGGFGLPGAAALSGRIEGTFRRQLEALPPDARRLLQVAAADPTGEPLLVLRAAERLGISADAARPAVEAGSIELDMRVRFRHPLVRSVAYRSGTLRERQEAHAALAAVTDPDLDPDRRAWHRAQASRGPDEAVACELESSADRARARGGIAAAAAFLARAVALTPEPQERGRRAVAAAEAMLSSGSPDEVLALLSVAEGIPLDEPLRAQIDLLRAFLAFSLNRGSDAPPLLLAAARRLEALDPELARETYLDAIRAALYAGRFTDGGVAAVAQAARSAPRPEGAPRAVDRLLDGFALMITEGYPSGAQTLRDALTGFADPDVPLRDLLKWGDTACYAASILWDERWGAISERMLALSREAGAGAALPLALTVAIGWREQAGELTSASTLVHELEMVAEATGTQPPVLGAAALAAWRGDESVGGQLLRAMRKDALERGQGMALTFIDWVSAVLYNGLGKYPQALEAARAAYEHPDESWSPLWMHELIEAAVRCGEQEQAAVLVEQLSAMAASAGTEKGMGVAARARALVSEGAEAESQYLLAIEHLARTSMRIDLARAHLLYGEWLRREGRRVDSRRQLREAHEMLVAMGVRAFAERARTELQATGEKVRRRTIETRDDLTPQERHIARLAGDRLTNQEIGAQLFLSHRTVEWHLRKVFSKLGITSRRELAQALRDVQPSRETATTPVLTP